MKAAKLPISAEDHAMLDHYEASVIDAYGAILKNAGNRFRGRQRLMKRFTGAMADLRRLGDRSLFAAVHEAHNELCFAAAVLSNSNPGFVSIDYEPPLRGTKQTVDFVARTACGLTYYIDAKTIKPKWEDRWSQFEKIRRGALLTPQTDMVLQQQWMGGVLWHGMFASRGRMLEYTLELEAKIKVAKLAGDRAVFVMAFGGENSGWTEDQLEDFVAAYRTGAFRLDDAFAKMEAHVMTTKKIAFDRTISGFAAMRRYEFDLHPEDLNWNVLPPRN